MLPQTLQASKEALSIVADRALFNGFSIWVGDIHRSTVELSRAALEFLAKSPGAAFSSPGNEQEDLWAPVGLDLANVLGSTC